MHQACRRCRVRTPSPAPPALKRQVGPLKWLDRHLKVYRPILPHSDSTFLFAGNDNGHKAPAMFATELRRLVQDQVGIQWNPYICRHLAVSMLLDDDPRNMSIAQRVISHAALKTTEWFYGQARTRGAQRKGAELLGRKSRELERRGTR